MSESIVPSWQDAAERWQKAYEEVKAERDLLLKDPANRLDGYREQAAKLLAATQRAEELQARHLKLGEYVIELEGKVAALRTAARHLVENLPDGEYKGLGDLRATLRSSSTAKSPPPCWRCSLPDGEHTPECITLQEKEAQTS